MWKSKLKVDLIDYMGSDLTVVNSARVSFDKASEWEGYNTNEFGNETTPILKKSDEKLINYLAKHNHFTPFTHCTITLREHVPIFVARQRFKHTVGFSYNEVSRRYVDSDPEFYIPDVWRGRPEGSVKQGSSDYEVIRLNPASLNEADTVRYQYQLLLDQAEWLYKEMIFEGVAPEQARMVLPQSMYTSYYTTGSLAAFARAFKLRNDAHSQKEIQLLATQWNEVIRPLFPVSWAALVD